MESDSTHSRRKVSTLRNSSILIFYVVQGGEAPAIEFGSLEVAYRWSSGFLRSGRGPSVG